MNRDRALHCTVQCEHQSGRLYVRVTARPLGALGVCTFVRRRAEQPRAPPFHKSRLKVMLCCFSFYTIADFAPMGRDDRPGPMTRRRAPGTRHSPSRTWSSTLHSGTRARRAVRPSRRAVGPGSRGCREAQPAVGLLCRAARGRGQPANTSGGFVRQREPQRKLRACPVPRRSVPSRAPPLAPRLSTARPDYAPTPSNDTRTKRLRP